MILVSADCATIFQVKIMSNELILILNLIFLYSCVIIFFYLFENIGLYVWSAIATILANIEVLIIVNAFGMRQTLGNILFATTFLVTDILSETYGKKFAQRAVDIGIISSLVFIFISQSWLFYKPDTNDFAAAHMKIIFSNTPRLIIASFIVYIIVQKFDVWLYHKLWEITSKISGDSKKYLWLRNNFATLVSQFLNVFLYTFAAFYGIYNLSIIWELIFSSYVIFIFTSLLDTPILYFARKIYFCKHFNS